MGKKNLTTTPLYLLPLLRFCLPGSPHQRQANANSMPLNTQNYELHKSLSCKRLSINRYFVIVKGNRMMWFLNGLQVLSYGS